MNFLRYKTDHMVSFCSWIQAFQTYIFARYHSDHQKNAQTRWQGNLRQLFKFGSRAEKKMAMIWHTFTSPPFAHVRVMYIDLYWMRILLCFSYPFFVCVQAFFLRYGTTISIMPLWTLFQCGMKTGSRFYILSVICFMPLHHTDEPRH